jgi:methylmalonyl-CoA mutase N-terminal domain/subunit
MVEAVKTGYPQREIADAAYELQTDIDSDRRIVVGVNRFREGDDGEMEILRIAPELERKQIERVRSARAGRDAEAVESALATLKQAAAGSVNLMAPLLEAARVSVSEGEIVTALQEIWGDYREQPVF